MPVQINEVVVRTTVDTKALCAPGSGDGDDNNKDAADGSDIEVIERVLEILREMKER
jgi:hypothetical protein